MIFSSLLQRILKTTEIPSVIINHMPIERVTCFTFIGVIIDSNLTWAQHINYILCNKLSRICGVLSRLKHYVPVLILKIIYNSLFLSHLNYGITAWGFNVGPRIKTLQKKAIRFISNAKYNSHTTPMFKNLHLLQAVDIFKLACFKSISILTTNLAECVCVCAKCDPFLPLRFHFFFKLPEFFFRIAKFPYAAFGPLFAFHCPICFTKNNTLNGVCMLNVTAAH